MRWFTILFALFAIIALMSPLVAGSPKGGGGGKGGGGKGGGGKGGGGKGGGGGGVDVCANRGNQVSIGKIVK